MGSFHSGGKINYNFAFMTLAGGRWCLNSFAINSKCLRVWLKNIRKPSQRQETDSPSSFFTNLFFGQSPPHALMNGQFRHCRDSVSCFLCSKNSCWSLFAISAIFFQRYSPVCNPQRQNGRKYTHLRCVQRLKNSRNKGPWNRDWGVVRRMRLRCCRNS